MSGIFVKRLVDSLPKDLKITVVTPCDTYPPEVGKGARHALVAFRYAPMAWQVLAHGPGGIPAALKQNRLLYLMLPALLLSMLIACIRVARSANVLHANWSVTGAVAGLAGQITATPVVTTLRGQDIARAEHSHLDRLLLWLTFRWSGQVVVVADGLADAVGKIFGRGVKKVMLIPNGVDDAFLAIKNLRKAKGGHLKLVFVGSLLSNKAVDIVLKAMAKVKAAGSISLVIAGDGPERQRLEALTTNLDLWDVVRFAGVLPAGEIPALLSSADALVLASYNEGRPNVVLEGMAGQLPVIATAIPGITELVTDKETGLLFPPGSVDALAASMVSLRDHSALRARMGKAGREFIIKNGLTWEEAGRRYAGVYQQIADEA